MQKATAQKEAVREAKERLGGASNEELAAYIRETFGLTIQPFIVGVLLGTFQERESLDRTLRAVREKVDAWKAENPEEAKKIADAVKRKETARRRKEKAAGSAPAESPDAGQAVSE